MAEPRLKSRLRVQAMLRAAAAEGCFGAVLRHGDDAAGGILLLLRATGGVRVLTETRTGDGAPAWLLVQNGEPAAADAYVARRLATDPDLWVAEIERAEADPPAWLGVPVLGAA